MGVVRDLLPLLIFKLVNQQTISQLNIIFSFSHTQCPMFLFKLESDSQKTEKLQEVFTKLIIIANI